MIKKADAGKTYHEIFNQLSSNYGHVVLGIYRRVDPSAAAAAAAAAESAAETAANGGGPDAAAAAGSGKKSSTQQRRSSAMSMLKRGFCVYDFMIL